MDLNGTARIQPDGPEQIVEREQGIGQALQRTVTGGQRRWSMDTVAEFVTQALPPPEAEQERFKDLR
jgi:hypothetical protein